MDNEIDLEDPTLDEFFLSHEDLLRLYEAEYGDTSNMKQCVYGTAESIYQQLYQLVLIVLAARAIKILCIPTIPKDFLLIGLGVYAIRLNVTEDDLFTTVLLVIGSLALFSKLLSGSSKGTVVTFVGILTIVLLEVYVEEVTVVRGVLMVFVMKISSVSFDYPFETFPSFVSLLAYILDPSTVIFGPFVRFSDYKESSTYSSFGKEVGSLFRAALCMLAAVVCVIYSSCHDQLFQVPSYLVDYVTAQSFRFSHYFICLFSQGLWAISGGSGYVTNPWPIELPRSLVDVVVAWNVPMHQYLRKYVFGAVRGWGSGAAIFLTFVVSSLLHGLNFQLSAVLISLGLLCYGENALRNRLSSRLSACVRSRPCLTCNHIRKKPCLLVFFINLLFSLLSIYHLVYLGMSFDGQSSSAGHVLSSWSRHFFASHIIAVVYLLLANII